MIGAAASCLTLLVLIFGMVAWANREKLREFWREITEPWNVTP